MDKISPQDEKRIMNALESAIKMTNAGESPNSALAKVASDAQFTAPIVQRIVEAYNVSKTLSHMKTASGPEKAESFPLADTEAILSLMYPSMPKTASQKKAEVTPHASFETAERVNFNKVSHVADSLPADWKKKAEEYGQDPLSVDHLKHNQLSGLKKKAEIARSEYRIAYHKTLDLAKEAADYFSLLTHTPFQDVEKKICATHGALGKSAMDLVYTFARSTEKRASEIPTYQVAYDRKQAPYCLIENLIKAAFVMHEKCDDAVSVEGLVTKFEKKAGLEVPEKVEPRPLLDDVLADGNLEKTALDPMSVLAGTGLGALGLKTKDPDRVERWGASEAVDPVHSAKLNSIKIQAMLNDFVSNDPVLSAYDPKDVLGAYNQLSELAPESTTQPALMRGLLRRVLQQEGVLEPHEVGQITNIEKSLRGSNYEPVFKGGSGDKPTF